MTFDEFLSKLKKVRRGSGERQSTACCPAHDDREPSLSITKAGDGRILFYCHAGCSQESVVSAMGLDMSDLRGNSQAQELPPTDSVSSTIGDEVVLKLQASLTPQARTYLQNTRKLSESVIEKYQLGLLEEDNHPRITIPIRDQRRNIDDIRCWLAPEYRARSTAPKIRHWKKGYGRARLYPADQLQYDELVFCEGELDALALISCGIPAVTLTAGASTKPNKAILGDLAGKTIHLAMDNDEAGRAGALGRAVLLSSTAKEVKIMEWPKDRDSGWDVTDELSEYGVESAKALVLSGEVFETSAARPRDPSDATTGRLRCLSDVESETIDWLWEPRIARQRLTLLDGDPGVGKSFITQAIAATLSRGGCLPEVRGVPAAPANSLLLTNEDDLGKVVRPRLDQMEAVTDHIFADDHALSLDKDGFTVVRDMVETIRPALVILDPIVAYLPRTVDMNKANEVRSVMEELAQLAKEYDCAILLVRHLAKNGANRAIHRGYGSIDFGAAARSILLAGHAPDNKEARALVQIKNNLGPEAKPLGYSVEGGIFNWTGPSDLTASRILAPDTEGSALTRAKSFLRERLSDGPAQSTDVAEEVRAAGISDATYRRARKDLNIKSEKNGPGGSHVISLPDDAQEGPSSNR